MTQEILQLTAIYPPAQTILESKYRVHRYWSAPDRAALIEEIAPRIGAVVTSGGGFGIKREMMQSLPALKLVACFGVGIDAVDLPAARELGIAVTNTPDVLTDEVADLAIGLLLATARRIVAADRYVREGKWLNGAMPMTQRVHGKKLGIIGMGRIGQAIASRAIAFDMEVAYQGPSRKDVPYRYEANLVALARSVDFMIAACPGGEATRGIVSAAVIEALGPQGIFVNIARGSVVDEPALIASLASGQLGGAGLDVFADEPRVPSALFALDNVVLQPHHASATDETRMAMGQLVLDNLAAFFDGRPLLTQVS